MTWSDVIVDQILFLATASDFDIHPDVAVAQLEAMTAGLRELGEEELTAIRSSVAERTDRAPSEARKVLVALLDSLA